MTWFKNLIIYRLNRDAPPQPDDIERQLDAFRFSPCSSQDMTKTGWVSPFGSHGDTLLHNANGQILLCARTEEKILPTPVLKQELHTKIEKLESEQHRKLKKTEKATLKDEVLHTLLPRAFSRFNQTFIWIDTHNSFIMVDTASPKRAENTLALLRKSVGSLPIKPLTFHHPVELTMTEWLRSGDLPPHFIIEEEAELKDTLEDGGVIRCKKQNLFSDEIALHITAGKRVTKLAVNWQERIQLMITENNALKRLKFSEELQEKNADIDPEDAAYRLNADFILMTSELRVLIRDMIDVMGGEASL